jgi:hypothetical protein
MNRFKKELIARGFRMEHLEECLPSQDGLDMVRVNSEKAEVDYYYIFAAVRYKFGRDMKVVAEEWI